MHAIKLTETGIEIDGTRLSLPLQPGELARIFSVPTRQIVVPLRVPSGASENRIIKIWDASGIFCLQDEAPPIIPELTVCLCRTETAHFLRHAFPGTIHAGTLLLNADTTPQEGCILTLFLLYNQNR